MNPFASTPCTPFCFANSKSFIFYLRLGSARGRLITEAVIGNDDRVALCTSRLNCPTGVICGAGSTKCDGASGRITENSLTDGCCRRCDDVVVTSNGNRQLSPFRINVRSICAQLDGRCERALNKTDRFGPCRALQGCDWEFHGCSGCGGGYSKRKTTALDSTVRQVVLRRVDGLIECNLLSRNTDSRIETYRFLKHQKISYLFNIVQNCADGSRLLGHLGAGVFRTS
nr:MAG TPA: hypothetical protein [Caudoviricetes sp.]